MASSPAGSAYQDIADGAGPAGTHFPPGHGAVLQPPLNASEKSISILVKIVIDFPTTNEWEFTGAYEILGRRFVTGTRF